MSHLLDIKYAFRLLSKSPLFTLLTVLVLSGGLALSIFSYSFLQTFIFGDLPLEEGETIVKFQGLEQGYDRMLDAADMTVIRPHLTSLGEIGMYFNSSVLIGQGTQSRNVNATWSEWNLFQFSRVQPLMGRGFRPDDSEPGAEKVAVIGYNMWQTHFTGRQDIIGAMVKINLQSTRIIGVMPEGYGFPVASKLWLPIPAEVFTTQQRNQYFVDVYARIKAGISEEAANLELNSLAKKTLSERKQSEESVVDDIYLTTFQAAQTNGADGIIIFSLMNMVTGFILLLAAINVGNMLLARMAERAKEMSIRVALGAPQKRLILQMMWESIIICVSGGVIALLLAGWALENVNQFWVNMDLADGLAYWWNWGLNLHTVLASLFFIIIAIIFTGVIPAWNITSGDFNAILRGGTRGAVSQKTSRLTRILLTVEITVVTILMYIGGISGILANEMIDLDIGMNTENILSAQIVMPEEKYKTAEAENAFYRNLSNQLVRNPNVTHALVTTGHGRNSFAQKGVTYQLDSDKPDAVVRSVTNDMEFLGIKLLAGRYLDYRDTGSSSPTVLISDTVSKRYWKGKSPIGDQISISEDLEGRVVWATIVGIVSDRVEGTPIKDPKNLMTVYRPMSQLSSWSVNVEYKYTGTEEQARSVMYNELFALDSEIVPSRFKSMKELLALLNNITTSATQLFLQTGMFALFLGVTGIYGLTSNAIVQRRHEIGIRRALGANDSHIIKWLIKLGISPLITGALIGIIVSAAVFTVAAGLVALETYMYIVAGVIVLSVISAAVVSAIYIPARRSIIQEPAIALRSDD